MSCSSPRKVTASREERTTNNDVCRRTDSAALLDAEAEVRRLLSRTEGTETLLILFDTEREVSDSTGLPPVMAVLKQTATIEEALRDTATLRVADDVRIAETVTDKSTEELSLRQETQERDWWRTAKRWLVGVGIALILIIALWGVYKLIKIFK